MSEGGAQPRVARRFHIAGRVQGVYFRAFTQQRAREIGVVGWVRNLADGRVECVAAGSMSQLERLRAVLAAGPSGARVVEVVEEPWLAHLDREEFEIRR
jgi:acylphosphatase